MIVMKFGGSSVKDADKIKQVCEIVKNNNASCVVFSAMKGITDSLIKTGELASAGITEYKTVIEEIRTRQYEAIDALISDKNIATVKESIDTLLTDLSEVLYGVYLIKNCSDKSLDLIVSLGERLNCTLISAYLNDSGTEATFIDAREIIKTDDKHINANVNFEKTLPLVKAKIKESKGISIITGFIASTDKGATTTLGRNGSDYTASIVGNAMDADVVEIWTDVDGVLTADPRIVKNAIVVPEISTAEAMELSYFGAEVIHPSTMFPAVEKNIPIYIKNTLNPTAVGTRIAKSVKHHGNDITGVCSIDDVSLINVEGSGMMGKPGIAAEVFTALASAKINIIMISQASSEHSICFVCRTAEADIAKEVLTTALAEDIANKIITDVKVQKDLTTISVIVENMIGRPGIAGRLFIAMGDSEINILSIAQGSSERNISLVINSKDKNNTINVIHDAFIK